MYKTNKGVAVVVLILRVHDLAGRSKRITFRFCFLFSGLSEKTNHFLEKNRGQENHIKVRLMTFSSYFNDFNLSKKRDQSQEI